MSPPGKKAIEKPKNFRKTWGKIFQYARAFIPFLVIALLCTMAGTALQILGPDKLKDMTAQIMVFYVGMPIDMQIISGIGFTLVGFYVGAAIFYLVEDLILVTIGHKISKRMRRDISEKINRLPLGYFNKVQHGDVLSRITNDADTVGQNMNQSISQLVWAFAMFVGVLIMMFWTSWHMALTAVGASLLGFFIIAIIMSKSQKYFKAQQSGLGDLNGHIEEMYTGHNVVRAYNASASSKKTFDKINNKLAADSWKAQFYSGLMMPLMMLIGNLGYVAVCVIGAVLTMKDIITFPVIIAFMIYVRLFTQPLSNFATAAQGLQRTAAAAERIFEFLDEKEMEDESAKQTTLQNVRGDVEFRNVRFGYTDDKIIIKDFSANVKAGQKIAIVGPTGAGKTTIVNLLMRFFELKGGQILIDGVSTADVPRENVHDQFCMVLQDSWLFEGTVAENVKYANSGVSDEAVIQACKTVGIHHIVQTMPDGYKTVLNENVSLSEGEKQLLTIARAVIKNSPLLILDEATSSVDTRTEALVQKAMDKLMKGRTSFVIAHRLSTIKNADLILVMNDGDIVESGTHTDLLEKSGFYAELYNSQFEQ